MSAIIILILRILIAACLYGFLAWAIVTIWRDLRNQGQMLTAPAIPNLTLALLDSQDAQQVSFNAPEIAVGRSQSCDYSILDDTVSARHARLSYHHNQWWLEDLKSTNGTFLNDVRLGGPTVIVSGDELRCGQVNLLISIAEKKR